MMNDTATSDISPDPAGVVIIGGGPGGLTAALELSRQGRGVTVLEKSESVGGIARTEVHDGYRFDIGGHRFFTKVPEIQKLWADVLGEQFLRVPRLSRIHYGGRFYNYPLNLWNTLRNLGPVESIRILFSYIAAKLFRSRTDESTFEQWVTNRFGKRLYLTFFKTYTEKVWGIPCTSIRSEWAAQRIKGVSLRSAVWNSIFKPRNGSVKSLIEEFDYPRLGPGMMWDRFAALIQSSGGNVRRGVDAVKLHRVLDRVVSVTIREAASQAEREIVTSDVISSMPIGELVRRLDPPAPRHVLEAAAGLRYRDFILVGLVVDRAGVFPDNWVYVHTPGVRVGRVQNFGNWSADMVAEPNVSSLGMEYFCTEGDDLWTRTDAELIALATTELSQLELSGGAAVKRGVVIRQRQAYPVYDETYQANLDVIRAFLETITNLQTIGRNGMHRYNNQDHSMLTGLLAARNVLAGDRAHDLWEVNVERSYHEELKVGTVSVAKRDGAAIDKRTGLRVATEARYV